MGVIAGWIRGQREIDAKILRELLERSGGRHVSNCELIVNSDVAIGRVGFRADRKMAGSIASVDGGICGLDGHVWRLNSKFKRQPASARELHGMFSSCGLECFSTIGGEFAAALWFVHTNLLLLVSDPIGVNRIYWARLPGAGLFFSNSALTVSRHPDVSKVADSESIACSFCGLPASNSSTHFRDVCALVPGHCLTFDNGKAKTEPYFKLSSLEDDDRGLMDIVEDYRKRFLQAVKTQGELSSSTAVSYSGGLDSTSILRALDKCVPSDNSNVFAVSAVVPGDPESNEVEYARAGIEGTNIEWIKVEPQPNIDWVEVVSTADRPDTILWVPVITPVLRAASEKCATRVLLGSLGDVVAGADMASLVTLASRFQVTTLLRECADSRRRWMPFAPRVLLKAFASATSVGRTFITRMAAEKAASIGFGVPPWVRESVERRYALRERWRHIHAWTETPVGRYSERFAEVLDAALAEVTTATHCSRLAGIEIGVPYADRDLAILSARLPMSVRRCRGVTRIAHREAMRTILPESIRTRTSKALFGGFYAKVCEHWIRPDYAKASNIRDWVDAEQLTPEILDRKASGWPARLANLGVVSEWLRFHCS